jgi:hypothetical protein
MAILRRLDRLAETGLALHSSLPAAVRPDRSRGALASSPDWDLMLSALRTGDEDLMAEAMVQVRALEGQGDKVGEVGDPPNRPPSTVNFDDDEDEEPERCWWDEEDECWVTDFPPPPGFDRYQRGRWGDEDYERVCTPEESKLLAAAFDAELAEERSEDAAERDQWFEGLKAGLTPPCGS